MMFTLVKIVLIYPVVFTVLLAYLLLVVFAGYCTVKAHWNELRPEIKVLLAPMYSLIVVDVLFNLIPATFIFLELPAQLTLTQRCDKHLKDTNYKGVLARYLCNNLLNIFQKDHCT